MCDCYDDITEITDLLFKHETHGAILAMTVDLEDVWLPKSAITVEPEYYKENDILTVSMPESLAEEKGLI